MESLRPIARPHVVLRAAEITKVFGETVALWNVDLECRTGELIAIHGANGSGKSTLLRIAAGLMAPTRGRVTMTSTAAHAVPRVGFMGHATHLFDELTPIENVALAARFARRDSTLAIDLLGQLGVAPYGAQRVATLSAGTRRRVGLARVLATDPDVLLLDEPLAGLDMSASDLVRAILVHAREDGRLVVVATHDDASSRLHATRTLHLEQRMSRPRAVRAASAMAG